MQNGSNPLYPKFSETVKEIDGNPILEEAVKVLSLTDKRFLENEPRLSIRLAIDSAAAKFHLLAKQARERIFNSDELSEALLYAAQEKIAENQKGKAECLTNLESTIL